MSNPHEHDQAAARYRDWHARNVPGVGLAPLDRTEMQALIERDAR